MSIRGLLRAINLTGWLVVVAVVVAWQLLVEAGWVDFEYVPAPSEVADGFVEILDAGELWPTVGHTLGVTLTATLLSMALGLILGAALGRLRVVDTYFTGTVDFLRSLPVVAMMPVVLLIWGPAGKTELAVATYAALWPMTINVAGAMRSSHPQLMEVAAVLRLSPAARFRKIIVPASLPTIVVSARLAVITALVVSIVAEMIVNPAGLGWALVQAQQALRPEQLWAWMLIAALLGYILNTGLLEISRRALPGSRHLLPGRGR